jgi:hypothetical protein
MTAWLNNISDALTTATTRLPQLTEHSLVTHRFDMVLSITRIEYMLLETKTLVNLLVYVIVICSCNSCISA